MTNEYTIIKKISKGSFGEVYEVENINNKYALKQTSLTHSLVEVNILFSLYHPNLLHGKHFSFEKGNIEILKERTLNLILPLADNSLHRCKDFTTIYSWIYQISSALYFLHENGYTHGDIKPDNILIKNGNLLLADFSLSSNENENRLPCASYITGSPQSIYNNYDGNDFLVINSEKIKRQKLDRKSTDIWSLACVIIFILTKGTHVFGSESIDNVCNNMSIFYKDREDYLKNIKVPNSFIPILLRMLEFDQDKRMSNLYEFFTALIPLDEVFKYPITGTVKTTDLKPPEDIWISYIHLALEIMLKLSYDIWYSRIKYALYGYQIFLSVYCKLICLEKETVKFIENLTILCYVCVYISIRTSSVRYEIKDYLDFLEKRHNIICSYDKFTKTVCLVCKYSSGNIIPVNIYSLAVSKKELIEGAKFCFMVKEYCRIGPIGFHFKYLEDEPSTEKNNRLQKNVPLSQSILKEILT